MSASKLTWELVEDAQARLDEMAKASIRTEYNEIEHRYEIVIDGVGLDAKGMQWEARCVPTSTGVQWRLSGALAKAVHALKRME